MNKIINVKFQYRCLYYLKFLIFYKDFPLFKFGNENNIIHFQNTYYVPPDILLSRIFIPENPEIDILTFQNFKLGK